MYQQYRKYRFLLMLFDVMSTVLVLSAVEKLRPLLPGRVITIGEGLPDPVVYLMVAVLSHAVFALNGVYDIKIVSSFEKQVRRLVGSYILTIIFLAGLLFFTFREISRMLVIYFAVGNLPLLLLIRFAVVRYLTSKRPRTGDGHTVIVGTSENGIFLANTMIQFHSSVMHVVGFVDDHVSDDSLPAPMLGSIEQLPKIITEREIRVVMIALPENRSSEIEGLVFRLESLPVRIYVVPDMARLAFAAADMELVGNLLVIGVREPVIKGHRRVAKRVFDVVLSSLMISALWPLMSLIALAIKLDSPGPVIYVARRVGENGKLFNMYKFRTMTADAEKLQSQVATKDGDGKPVFKVKEDPRVTRIGKLLRRTSLDELAQLFNVLRGDMSLVGPRPEQPFITETYDHWQWQRLSVPPGVTGLWQISGRSDLPMHLNTQYDIYYVRNYSTLLDLKILLKTVGVVLKGRGAY
ncbi:MAG: sugar transferase [Desulfomonile tiedjei]|uniref:Sugar transferase n=1 Tax=Desulfomonile tiedjei TaxID=2358 RepID=A0A9D6YYY5_9BACT|nr:sugar transferase [Desulfomonile tiedjei]